MIWRVLLTFVLRYFGLNILYYGFIFFHFYLLLFKGALVWCIFPYCYDVLKMTVHI